MKRFHQRKFHSNKNIIQANNVENEDNLQVLRFDNINLGKVSNKNKKNGSSDPSQPGRALDKKIQKLHNFLQCKTLTPE